MHLLNLKQCFPTIKIHLHFSSNSHLMQEGFLRISAVILLSKKVLLRQAVLTLSILNVFTYLSWMCENSSHERWILVQSVSEISNHKMWNTNRQQNHEKSFEHPAKIWEKFERIREEVSISCNCADKAKIINRFSIDSLKKLFKIELFKVSKWLAMTSNRLYHSKKSNVLSVFTTCDMLLTGPSAAIIIEWSPLVQTRDPRNCGAVSSFDISS